jgi:hypothetical protein
LTDLLKLRYAIVVAELQKVMRENAAMPAGR